MWNCTNISVSHIFNSLLFNYSMDLIPITPKLFPLSEGVGRVIGRISSFFNNMYRYTALYTAYALGPMTCIRIKLL